MTAVTCEQAARLLGVSVARLEGWARLGEGPEHVTFDGDRLYDLTDVRDWLRALPVSPDGLPILPDSAAGGQVLH